MSFYHQNRSVHIDFLWTLFRYCHHHERNTFIQSPAVGGHDG
ncbi:hypothetical protein B932_3335 [Gluconobacter oxydans H24]|nr:hypothetical protein B932_3335 [Gluconobacter oxydans H24]